MNAAPLALNGYQSETPLGAPTEKSVFLCAIVIERENKNAKRISA